MRQFLKAYWWLLACSIAGAALVQFLTGEITPYSVFRVAALWAVFWFACWLHWEAQHVED
ncbi:hypothetical protein [Ruegeria sp. YS9]|uniref:hypothetical protein n=1 Tax=Ruegeria sp. YS9 TaxID=2966453 RepID=UPI00214CC8DB|nr:hypothetical protein [Ruegeria sp. YS9]UUV08710.1 hypothetical protein NOR97_20765 [Ruegeria sp. YS9]